MIGSIVKFRENAKHLAAQWCRKHDLCGKVIGETPAVLQIDVGLDYKIYALSNQVQVVSPNGEIPPLSPELQESAPIPDDGY